MFAYFQGRDRIVHNHDHAPADFSRAFAIGTAPNLGFVLIEGSYGFIAGKAQLIDIRFPEEFAAWHMGFATNIPLNELPARLGELDKSKLIVTACPHYDRSSMARLYLLTKCYRARYLNVGLLGLADLLRGDRARDFTNAMSKKDR